jgi:excisionase family DNA binding protein
MTAAVYTADELAAMLGCDRKTVYSAAERGQLPSRRLGRRVIFPRAAIDAWLAAVSAAAPCGSPPTPRRRVRRSPRAKPPQSQE